MNLIVFILVNVAVAMASFDKEAFDYLFSKKMKEIRDEELLIAHRLAELATASSISWSIWTIAIVLLFSMIIYVVILWNNRTKVWFVNDYHRPKVDSTIHKHTHMWAPPQMEELQEEHKSMKDIVLLLLYQLEKVRKNEIKDKDKKKGKAEEDVRLYDDNLCHFDTTSSSGEGPAR